MGHLSPEEQLRRAGKTKESFTKEFMDYLVMLYSDQTGVLYTYTEIPAEDKTA